MEFSWSETQQAAYKEALAFARDRLVSDRIAEPDAAYAPGSARWQMCGAQGLLGLCAPDSLGGAGLDAMTTARVLEALGTGCDDMGLLFSISAHLFACVVPIAMHASPDLQVRLLPGLCSGALIGANAITEAEAGSDVFSLSTLAERDNGAYVLNGVKSYVTNGPLADITIVYAKTDPSAGYLGVSAFAVERESPGFRFGQPFRKMGLHSAPIASLYLDNCRVPASSLIGEEGSGASVFRTSMHWERVCLFAAYIGQMSRHIEQAVCHARTRRQFGKRLAAFQAVSHKIAGMKLRMESARLLLYKACWSLQNGCKEAALDISLAKLAVSEAAVQSGIDTMQIYGGMGYTADMGIEQDLRDALAGTIFSGTSEIQRDLVARELGL